MKKELKDQKELKQKVEAILKQLNHQATKSISTTDKDCTRINSLKGSSAGYSLQGVADEKHGLIVSAEVVSKNNDIDQFSRQITKANRTLERKCKNAAAMPA
jgi:hypothetical protein